MDEAWSWMFLCEMMEFLSDGWKKVKERGVTHFRHLADQSD